MKPIPSVPVEAPAEALRRPAATLAQLHEHQDAASVCWRGSEAPQLRVGQAHFLAKNWCPVDLQLRIHRFLVDSGSANRSQSRQVVTMLIVLHGLQVLPIRLETGQAA